jgi:hypothetical protein
MKTKQSAMKLSQIRRSSCIQLCLRKIILCFKIDWLIDWLFTVSRPSQEYFTYMETSHYRWRAAKFRPMLCAQGLWIGRDVYRATPAVTRNLGFSGLIRRTAPFSRLLRHTRGCGESILTGTSRVLCFKMNL